MSLVRIQNKLPQTLNLLLTGKDGKVGGKALLPKAFVDVDAGSLTEAVFGLLRHGHVALHALADKKDSKSAKASAPAPAKDTSGAYKEPITYQAGREDPQARPLLKK